MWGYHGVASARDVVGYLSRLRVRVPTEDVEGALAGLERRGVVERLGGRNYRIKQQVFGGG
jgi:hypothetical protein